jgi:hypothetical protein
MNIRLVSGLIVLNLFLAFAQALAQAAESLSADVDSLVTIHKMSVMPVTDNVNGLYSHQVEGILKQLINQTHRFELQEVKVQPVLHTSTEFENQGNLVKSVASQAGADAFISAEIEKNESGVNLKLDLFLRSDGLLLAQVSDKISKRFALSEIDELTRQSFSALIKKIPYDGLILSREGNRVTVDIGSLDGIAVNTVVTVDHIVSLNRHPKFHFALGAERVTIGKIKLVKVDETLSFGLILEEKEPGMISTDQKLSGLNFVNYLSGDSKPGENNFSGNSVTYKTKQEYIPEERPSFGKIGVSLGFGSLRSAVSFQTLGSYEGESSFYPQLQLEGEIWITKNWYSGTHIRQGTVSQIQSTAGGVGGAVTTTDYDLYAGYKFLLQNDDFWGPQINTHLGFASHSMTLDSASLTSLSSTRYSGLYYGLGGVLPLNKNHTFYADLNLDRFFLPQFSENPYASGAASDSSAMQIAFGGSYALSNNLWLSAHLQYEFFSTTFTGTGERNDVGLNSSQNMTTLFTTVSYYF